MTEQKPGSTGQLIAERQGTIPRQDRPTIQSGHWERILRVAAEANHLFPQAYLAQGFRVAAEMVKIASEDNVPLSVFQVKSPDDKMIRENLGPERIRGHEEHGFRTVPVGNIDLPGIWRNDRSSAMDILILFAKQVYKGKYGTYGALLNQVQNDPVFQGLIATAAQSLTLPEITTWSAEYKKKIREFMQKYPPQDHEKPIPDGYKGDRDTLMTELEVLIRNAALKTKEALVTYLQAEHPQNDKLKDDIANTPIYALLRTPYRGNDYRPFVKLIDPLKLGAEESDDD